MVKKARRIYRELTSEEQTHLEEVRALAKEELPQLIERHRLAEIAQEEDTFSGELRRRIHKSDVPITEIARQCGTGLTELDEFLTGERTLPSSVIDQLVEILGCKLVPIE